MPYGGVGVVELPVALSSGEHLDNQAGGFDKYRQEVGAADKWGDGYPLGLSKFFSPRHNTL